MLPSASEGLRGVRNKDELLIEPNGSFAWHSVINTQSSPNLLRFQHPTAQPYPLPRVKQKRLRTNEPRFSKLLSAHTHGLCIYYVARAVSEYALLAGFLGVCSCLKGWGKERTR